MVCGVSARCPEIGTSFVDWAQLSVFYLKTGTESSFLNVVLNKNRMMDNVQRHNSCNNAPQYCGCSRTLWDEFSIW
jgi:hypothetical protein